MALLACGAASARFYNELHPLNATALAIAEEDTNRRTRCPPDRTAGGLTVIRVGVLHTPQAAALPRYVRGGGGNGSRAVEAAVVATISETNDVVYRMSGVKIELHLCANHLVADTTLEHARPSDTLVAFSTSQEVRAVRDLGACDVMVLFSSLAGLGNRACGIGYMFPGAHAVVAAPCFTENYSFVHELGHTLGACHGGAAGMCGAGANGFGSSQHGFRTVEAYDTACGSNAAVCTRIPRVSNRDRAYVWNDYAIGDTRHSNAWILNANRESASARYC